MQPLLKKIFTGGFFLSIVILLSCCNKEKPGAARDITSFSLNKADGTPLDTSKMSVTVDADTIKIIVPAGTDITRLIPTIVISGVTISPASGAIQNFTNPVNYTVTAEDGSTKKYVVQVKFVALNNILFIGCGDNNFYALDATNGSLKWKYTGNNSFVYSSPTYKNGVVYVGSIDNHVYAFDASNGDIIWRFLADGSDGIESDAVISDSTVFVGANDDKLYALNAVSGELRWKFNTGGNVSSSPVIANGTVYFGSSDGNLYALNAATGGLVWTYTTNAMINQSGCAVINGTVYVGSRDSYLHAVDAATGMVKWRFSTNGISLEQSSPTVKDGIVYIGGWYDIGDFTRGGNLYALDAATGKLVWESLIGKGFSTSPYVKNSRLYICSDDGYVNAINTSNGGTLWQKLVLSNSSSPLEVNNILYVGGGGTGYIYALDAATGNEIWKFPTPNGLSSSSPLVINDSGVPQYTGDSGALQ